jgi:hypothetical protein
MHVRELPRDAEIRVLTHRADVDGVVCAAIVLRRFPRAVIRTGEPKEDLAGEYDMVVDLPLKRGLRVRVWIDHHQTGNEGGQADEVIHDPKARSAAGLLARYLGTGTELAELADRADSAGYQSPPPTGDEAGYDPAWDINDAVKAIEGDSRFVELARILSSGGVEAVRRAFGEEIARTRELRRRADELADRAWEAVRSAGADAAILLMPGGELSSPTVSGRVVFSLYDRGVKCCAVFYEGGCWFNVRKDFEGVDASAIAKRFGGGGHRKSAGAPIGPEQLESVKREFERASLRPAVVDLRMPAES